MNVIHTPCLQNPHGIFYSFPSVLHEWLKTGHKSFTTHQLFPVAFLSACLMGPGAQQGLLPINNTGRKCSTCHRVSASQLQKQQAKHRAQTKSKPTIFQGCYFICNPGELLGAMGIYLLKQLSLAGLMGSVLSLNGSLRGVQTLVFLSSPYLPRLFQNG